MEHELYLLVVSMAEDIKAMRIANESLQKMTEYDFVKKYPETVAKPKETKK